MNAFLTQLRKIIYSQFKMVTCELIFKGKIFNTRGAAKD
ncbi:hypothetical protein VIBC2010_02870 [Vibrio caribbeanicus ATCC BAA-2122]|uniref:Uncharacterized protein n=1 Tax=Vibrio caribbeanicus ATCC BAA-2122 TaxID=796620 RepID=E3BGB2_9VIBR|nr:hypothetical protein VIBC2010_02870 [Vibrio caribbeanicus ATCC BAA-2122]